MHRDNQRFRTHARLLIGVVCSLLIIGSSIILLILHNTSAQRSSTLQSTASTSHVPTTNTPTSTGTEGITPIPTPLFSDDFSNNSQSWYMNNAEGYTRSLTAAGLTLTNTNHNPMIESLPVNHKFDDFLITTTFTLQQGDKNDSVGVYLRGDSTLYHDYRIDIFGNSMYAISKEYLDIENTPQILYIVPPSHASQLRPLGASNTLTVLMKGPTMILLINGKLVNVIIDEDYIHGQIALFVAHGVTSPGVTAIFSSIEIDPAPDQFPFISACTVTPTSTVTPTNTGSSTTPTTCR